MKIINKNNETNICQRTLIYIPIIHTANDMGTLNKSIQQTMLQRLSIKTLRHKLRLINKMWTEIEQSVEQLRLTFDKVRLYQDGLPVCGRELEIVTELANKGSRNHKLLLRLIQKGASIMGTESSDLLLEEYENVKKALVLQNIHKIPKTETPTNGSCDSLLERRNRYIADRINGTLLIGETGILFLGMLHSLENFLDKDICVTYLALQPFHYEGAKNEAIRIQNSDCR